MEIRLFVLAVYVFASCLADDTKSPNAPVITSAITKVARANEGEVTKKTPKPISNIDLNIATTITTTTSSTTSNSNLNEGEKSTENENVSSTENIWTALESFLATPSTVESSVTSVASSFMKLLQSLDDVTPATNTEVEHNGRFARGVVAEEEENEEEDEDEDDSTPLTPSLEDALSRLANARDDKVISFESDTIPSPLTPPPISPAWARVPLYYQGAGLQLSREPSPPALVNPALTSVPSNTLDLSALLAMMLRSYPSSPSPLIPNLLFPSMSIVNRTSNYFPQPLQGPRNSVNSLFGKSYNPPKMAPDMKLDDKDGSSKELDPAESTQDKVSAKKPDDNDYEYEYVYYYYDEDDPNNKTMVVKPASAVKPKNNDQKLGLTAVPALLPRQPVGPSAAEGRSVEGGSADNALRDQDDRTLSPLLTPHFTTPSVVAKPPPLPFVQGPQSPVMFLGIQRETYQGPRVPARTHPAKEPDDLYAFSRAFDDHTSQSVEPFTYKPNFDSENEGRVFEPNSTDDDILLPSKSKTTTTKAPKKTTTTATTTTEKATTNGRGRRPGGGRRGRTSTAPPTTTTKGRRAPNRRGNNRKNKGKGKETTEKVEEDEEEVTTEKPARGGRKGGRPTRTRTTSKPRGGRRKTTTSSRNGKAKTTATVSAAANDEVTTVASAVTTAKRGLSNLFPRRKTLRPLTTTAAPSEEEGGNEEEEVQVSTTEKVVSTTNARKVRSTTTPATTTVGELSEEGVEVEAEVEESNPVTSQAPKSPIQRLRPLRPLRVKTTVEPDSS